MNEPKWVSGKPILTLDFDGVCHSYTSGWKGMAVVPDPPVPGLFEFLDEAVKEFEVNIFSSRSCEEVGIVKMRAWFRHHCPVELLYILGHLRFPTVKPPSFIGLDDRVLTFTGTWPSIEAMKNFKTWTQKGADGK